MELNKVYNLNFLDNTLPDKSVQLIIADPPYFEVKGAFDFVWPSFDAYLSDVERWAQECKRVLADNGTLFWYGHAKKIAYAQIVFDRDFNLVNNLVWRKLECQTLRNQPSAQRSFAPVTERILMYSNETDGIGESEKNYQLQIGRKHTEIMEPIISYMIGEMKAAGYDCPRINKETGTCMSSHWFARTSQWCLPTKEWYAKLQKLFNGEYLRKEYEELRKEYEELRRPFNMDTLITDVLEYSQESHITKAYEHETKKPEGLTRMLIQTCSRPNDIVLAPFAGSGTECAMAIKEGRRCIGFDIEPKYVEMANKRIEKHLSQPTIF